ncbi:hypothetical protein [Hymenobacter aerophilus]|uniref:hypothetical protein n=1 Tax=Hymenobacter aerophilus TaxID=119644 RepID=UPI0012FC4C9F|nr:hypothetical protein [Hymenobacter aerophilus]
MKQPFALMLAVLPFTVAAQTSTDTTYRHQLGLTASPQLHKFFQANRSLPLGLLYKRRIKVNQMARVRLVGQYSWRDTMDVTGILPGSSIEFWELSGYVGYEWQRPIGRRTTLTYGAEVGTGVSRRDFHDKRIGQDIGGAFQYDVHFASKQWQLEARPFLGINVAIAARLHVFAESALSASYNRRRDSGSGTAIRTYPNSPPTFGFVPSYATADAWRLRWRPVQLIGLTLAL